MDLSVVDSINACAMPTDAENKELYGMLANLFSVAVP